MESLSTPNKFRPIGLIAAFGAIAMTAGCAAGSYEVKANVPATVINESTSESYIPADANGGYGYYETTYRFVLEQCMRKDLEIADKDGCVTLDTQVDKTTYDNFGIGDSIVFNSPRRGYPINQ